MGKRGQTTSIWSPFSYFCFSYKGSNVTLSERFILTTVLSSLTSTLFSLCTMPIYFLFFSQFLFFLYICSFPVSFYYGISYLRPWPQVTIASWLLDFLASCSSNYSLWTRHFGIFLGLIKNAEFLRTTSIISQTRSQWFVYTLKNVKYWPRNFRFWINGGGQHVLLGFLLLFNHSVMSNSLGLYGLQQISLAFTISQSLLKLMSIELVVSSNHLILCHPLLLLPSIFPSIRVFSNELALSIRWPKYWKFSFSISPSNDYSGMIFSRIDWFDLLAVPGTLKHGSSKASVLRCLAIFRLQLSHLSVHDYWKKM